MPKLLNGTELVGYIEERQARQVRGLRQAYGIFPRLVIIKSTNASPVIDTYIRMKKRYGDEIAIETMTETLEDDAMPEVIARLNANPLVHGIIIQLPINDTTKTRAIVNLLAPEKDVDGLGDNALYDSATAMAINWLLAGYAVDLKGRKLTIVGNGVLVGAPLARIWRESNYDVTVLDKSTVDITEALRESDVIVTATGVPRLITSAMIPVGATVVDAGTASEDGGIVGDISDDVRTRDDIKVTPEKGGVGPLTITALFDNVIRSATRVAEQLKE